MASRVTWSDKKSGENSSEDKSEDLLKRLSDISGVCQLCLKQSSNYTCPRCNIPYCSLICYKSEKHVDCSETFYKESVLEELKQMKGRPEEKRRMMEMLKNFEDEESNSLDSDDEDDSTEQSLAERLQGLDLDKDSDQIWERLTNKERQEFQEVLQSGQLGKLLPDWTPWWTYHHPDLIELLDPDPDERDNILEKEKQGLCPSVLTSIPKLSELMKNAEPSPTIIYNIINALYCYCVTLRFFNGTFAELPIEAAKMLVFNCPVLSSNMNFSDASMAIASSTDSLMKVFQNTPSGKSKWIQDVVHVLLGRSPKEPLVYLLGAISDLHKLLTSAKAEISRDKNSSEEETKLKKLIFRCKKKLEFYLAWIQDNPLALKSTAVELQYLYTNSVAEEEQNQELEKAIDNSRKEGNLLKMGMNIEELS